MKKKIISFILILSVIACTVSASNTFELEQVFYPIYANGNLVPEDELPVLSYKDRTYVPLRKLSEASGLGVYFDDEEESIYIANLPLQEAKVYYDFARAYSAIEEFGDIVNEFQHISKNCVVAITSRKIDDIKYSMSSLQLVMDENLIQREINFISLAINKIQSNHYATVFIDDYQKYMEDIKSKLNLSQDILAMCQNIYQLLNGWCDEIYTETYLVNSFYGNNRDGIYYQLNSLWANLLLEGYEGSPNLNTLKFNGMFDLLVNDLSY